MMSGQVHSGPPHKKDDESDSVEVQVTKQVREFDDILEEIDAALETNAAAFVNGFIQKGGQ
jgi:ubiquitin-like protein Pup